MNKRFENKIKKAIHHLPDFEHNIDVWDKICSELKFRDHLDQRIAELPTFEPKENLWEDISNKLSITSSGKQNKIISINLYRAVSVAAGIVLFIGLYFVINNYRNKDITVSEEFIYPEKQKEGSFISIPDEALVYINEQCRIQNSVCSSTEFTELKQQLLEIDEELAQIKEYQNKYAESQALIKSIIKMENIKSDIIIELMKRLNS